MSLSPIIEKLKEFKRTCKGIIQDKIVLKNIISRIPGGIRLFKHWLKIILSQKNFGNPSFKYNSDHHINYGHWDIPLVRQKLLEAKFVVEIGSFLGHSSISFAKLSSPLTKIICVDPWESEERHCSSFQKFFRRDTYEQFLSNCSHHKCLDKIIPIRLDSLNASFIFGEKYDVIYIDGDHSEEGAYQDLKHWYSKKSEKALICGDDWTLFNNWEGHNQKEFYAPKKMIHSSKFNEHDKNHMVRRGVKRFAQEYGIDKINSFGRLWWFNI